MADEILIFDATGSNPDGTNPGSPLSIGPGTSYPLAEASFPAPPQNVLYASSVDTEGEIPVSRRYGNRTITLRLEMDEVGAVNTLLDALQAKFAKLQREGGTVKRTRKDGSTIRIYDIVAGDGFEWSYDDKYILAHSTGVTLSLPAKPLARGAEVDLGDNVETTLPALIFTDTGVLGDVDALGRLVVDNDSAVDWAWTVWGIESDAAYTHTSSSGSGALFYEAETRTVLGGATAVAGPSGASGAGSNVVRQGTLTPSYQAMLSTQATGGGAHLTHVGEFDVYARVQMPTTNTGAVSVALEWTVGDFTSVTRNASVEFAADHSREGQWALIYLGPAAISKTLTGTQRWEGRIIAKSTVAGDDLDVDYLMFVPVSRGSATAAGRDVVSTPTSFVARDEFDQSAGVLTTKVLPVGGSWSLATGDTDDFNVSGTGAVTRTAVSDTAARFEQAGTTNYTNVVVEVVVTASDTNGAGVYARYLDASNWVRVTVADILLLGISTRFLVLERNVAGVITTTTGTTPITNLVAGVGSATVRLVALGTNNAYAYALDASGKVLDSLRVDGGLQSTGKIGIVDYRSSAAASTRTFDSFAAWAPIADAAIFAGQSLEVRYDGASREDSTGVTWGDVSDYTGDYLLVPPAGAEGRSVRMIVKPCRNDPEDLPDTAIDDVSARLFATPRYLT